MPPTLATLIDNIHADTALPGNRKREVVSAIRTIARTLGALPEDVPAVPAVLRQRLQSVGPAMAGVSKASWQNAMSRFRFALKHGGITYIPGRSTAPLSQEWADVLAMLTSKYDRYELSRFGRFCMTKEIGPNDVNDEVLADFHWNLREAALVRQPDTSHRTVCIAWNKAVATIPAWPRRIVEVPSYLKHFTFSWETFPPSLKQDVDAYLLNRPDKVDPWGESDLRPLRPASVKYQTIRIRGFASAVVHQGVDPASLRTLADLVTPDAYKKGLQFLLARAGGKYTADIFGRAHEMQTIAKHWVKVDEARLEEMKRVSKRLNPGSRGMTAKNRQRLRQFDNEDNVQALLELPARIFARVGRVATPSHPDLLEIQAAIGVELLIMLPMRLKNLVEFDIARHLQRRHGVVSIAIPNVEVKNATAIEARLHKSTARLLDLYLKRYRPLLSGAIGTDWLFPNPSGNPKSEQAVRKQLTGCVRRNTGLIVNPHLYRHLAAKLYLEAHPGEYDTVRLLIGHKSVKTTTRFYSGTEMPAAVSAFTDFILDRRGDRPSGMKRGGRGAVRHGN